MLRPLRYLRNQPVRTTASQTQSLVRTRELSTITLSDDMLLALNRRPEVINQFPFLRLAPVVVQPQTRGGCKKCNQRAAERMATQSEFQRVKQLLASAPQETLDAFKKKINADSVIFFFKTPAGKVERRTF